MGQLLDLFLEELFFKVLCPKGRPQMPCAIVFNGYSSVSVNPLLGGFDVNIGALEIAADKGASNWLTSLPLERYNFALSKTEWRDAVGPLRYLLPPKNFPSTCACGAPNSVIHAQNCHLGGFLGLRHDTVRNTIAHLLETAKGCSDIEIEKHLTPLENDEKKRAPRTSNTTEGARMDVTALGFWGPLQRVFCDIRVFNPLAPSKGFKSAEAQKKDNEKEKKDAYQWRVKEIERGTFTPLVFTVQGGCGRECDAFLKQLSEKIAKKSGEDQSSIMAWIRTKLSFALVRTSAVSYTHLTLPTSDLV